MTRLRIVTLFAEFEETANVSDPCPSHTAARLPPSMTSPLLGARELGWYVPGCRQNVVADGALSMAPCRSLDGDRTTPVQPVGDGEGVGVAVGVEDGLGDGVEEGEGEGVGEGVAVVAGVGPAPLWLCLSP